MTERGKALRLVCWNADGVRGRNLDLEHFLNQHGVDICLLSETFLNRGQAFRLTNYAYHRTENNSGGGTAILVRRGIVPLSALSGSDPFEGYCHSSLTRRKPVKTLAA
jgi:exonuclease III